MKRFYRLALGQACIGFMFFKGLNKSVQNKYPCCVYGMNFGYFRICRYVGRVQGKTEKGVTPLRLRHSLQWITGCHPYFLFLP